MKELLKMPSDGKLSQLRTPEILTIYLIIVILFVSSACLSLIILKGTLAHPTSVEQLSRPLFAALTSDQTITLHT